MRCSFCYGLGMMYAQVSVEVLEPCVYRPVLRRYFKHVVSPQSLASWQSGHLSLISTSLPSRAYITEQTYTPSSCATNSCIVLFAILPAASQCLCQNLSDALSAAHRPLRRMAYRSVSDVAHATTSIHGTMQARCMTRRLLTFELLCTW